MAGATSTDYVELVGKVLEADVRQKRFQLWTDNETHVSVDFSESEEAEVTTALRDHRSLCARVKGRAEFSPQGQPLRVTEIESLALEPVGEAPHDNQGPPIEEVLAELARQVPKGEWDKLPSDLTDNLDHYVYGTPKR
jgi:hypothetical protein